MPEILIYLAVIVLSFLFRKKKPEEGMPQGGGQDGGTETQAPQPGESIEDILREMMGEKKKPVPVPVREEVEIPKPKVETPKYPTFDDDAIKAKYERSKVMDVATLIKKKYHHVDQGPMKVIRAKQDAEGVTFDFELEDLILADVILNRKYN